MHVMKVQIQKIKKLNNNTGKCIKYTGKILNRELMTCPIPESLCRESSFQVTLVHSSHRHQLYTWRTIAVDDWKSMNVFCHDKLLMLQLPLLFISQPLQTASILYGHMCIK